MRSTRAAIAAIALCLPATAAAGPDPGRLPVMGGTDVPAGVWSDAGAVIIGGIAACTGVLIAPNVALTAGHCNDSSLSSFWVGTNNLGDSQSGERLPVTRRIEYPSSGSTFDITVLVLGTPSTIAPRAIATGWARLDIANGALVQIVGFGAIDRNASQYVDELQEAETTITDFDCSQRPGCNAGAQPAGELGAGGMGIDTCPGDSGGPLYLKTPYGDFLAGITSRAYADADFPCQDGGIYERPDAIVDWIEESAGVPVSRGPEPSAPAIQAVRGDLGETEIEANDPLSDEHRFSIPAQPAHGIAAVDDDGDVKYCANADYTGPDTVDVLITDRSDADRAVMLSIGVDVVDGEAPDSCSVEFDGGGCCSTGTRLDAGSAAPFVVVGAVLLRRRRKQR